MTVWVNKTFEVGGESVEVDYPTYQMLNVLAAKFYLILNYTTEGYHDFYASTHPMENNMFIMALEAYAFHLAVGFD